MREGASWAFAGEEPLPQVRSHLNSCERPATSKESQVSRLHARSHSLNDQLTNSLKRGASSMRGVDVALLPCTRLCGSVTVYTSPWPCYRVHVSVAPLPCTRLCEYHLCGSVSSRLAVCAALRRSVPASPSPSVRLSVAPSVCPSPCVPLCGPVSVAPSLAPSRWSLSCISLCSSQ